MNKKLHTFRYVLVDYFSALIAWCIFFTYRKYTVSPFLFEQFDELVLNDINLYIGIAVIPIYWLLLYTFSGYYRKIFRKSRLKELEQTLISTFFGTIILFFAIILDDMIISYRNYLEYYLFLYATHFALTYLPRFIITTMTVRKIHRGIIGFNTVLIGNDQIATEIYLRAKKQNVQSGNKFIGYVFINPETPHPISEYMPCLGSIDELKKIIKEHDIEEVIIAVQNGKRKYIEQIFSVIENSNVVIKIIPQIQDILLGSVKMTSVLQEPLIQIYQDLMPEWQKQIKRFMDIFLSVVAIILLFPLYLFLALGVKHSSKGPIFYKQERIGHLGNPFYIFKFRSMFVNSEENGPQLSSKEDTRITPFGKIMRKTRLDELPQFFNVLRGDMSLVGPRPERQFYIDQIVKVAPHYRLLHRIKPGITSWGQVKYGYAENVDEMVERLKYDLVYLENMSLQMDIKILIHTALIVLQGRGT